MLRLAKRCGLAFCVFLSDEDSIALSHLVAFSCSH